MSVGILTLAQQSACQMALAPKMKRRASLSPWHMEMLHPYSDALCRRKSCNLKVATLECAIADHLCIKLDMVCCRVVFPHKCMLLVR